MSQPMPPSAWGPQPATSAPRSAGATAAGPARRRPRWIASLVFIVALLALAGIIAAVIGFFTHADEPTYDYADIYRIHGGVLRLDGNAVDAAHRGNPMSMAVFSNSTCLKPFLATVDDAEASIWGKGESGAPLETSWTLVKPAGSHVNLDKALTGVDGCSDSVSYKVLDRSKSSPQWVRVGYESKSGEKGVLTAVAWGNTITIAKAKDPGIPGATMADDVKRQFTTKK